MRTAFVLALIGFFFVLALTSRVAGMYTYWWFGVFRPQDWVWTDLSSFRLPLIAAIVFVIPALFSKMIPKFNHPLAVLMLLYCILAAVANILNGCDNVGFDNRTRTVFELFILVYMVLLSVEVINDRKALFGLILVVALSLGFHSGKGGIYALMTGANYYDAHQLQGFLSGSNAYAMGTALVLFYMIFSFQQISRENGDAWYKRRSVETGLKAILAIVILGSFYNIIALQSRGSFMAVIVGLFVWFLLNKKNLKILIPVFMLTILALTVVPLPQGFEDRIQSIFLGEEERDKSAESRPHFWKAAVRIANDHPFGVGPGCYPHYYNLYDNSGGAYGYYRSVHSSHFQIISDTGYPGLLVWIALFIITLRRLWTIRKQATKRVVENDSFRFYIYLSNALLASSLVFLIGGAFYEFGYNDITWLTFGIVIAIDRLFQLETSGNQQDSDNKGTQSFTRRI